MYNVKLKSISEGSGQANNSTPPPPFYDMLTFIDIYNTCAKKENMQGDISVIVYKVKFPITLCLLNMYNKDICKYCF